MATAATPKDGGRVLEMKKTDDGYEFVCCVSEEGLHRFKVSDNAFCMFARGLSEGEAFVLGRSVTLTDVQRYIAETTGNLGSVDQQARSEGILCAMAMNGPWPWPPR